MDVKSCAKLVVLMLVAMIELQASATEVNSSLTCKAGCAIKCALTLHKDACVKYCYDRCPPRALEVEKFESQCNLDCMVSKCLELYPDAKKVKSCVNSCPKNCKNS